MLVSKGKNRCPHCKFIHDIESSRIPELDHSDTVESVVIQPVIADSRIKKMRLLCPICCTAYDTWHIEKNTNENKVFLPKSGASQLDAILQAERKRWDDIGDEIRERERRERSNQISYPTDCPKCGFIWASCTEVSYGNRSGTSYRFNCSQCDLIERTRAISTRLNFGVLLLTVLAAIWSWWVSTEVKDFLVLCTTLVAAVLLVSGILIRMSLAIYSGWKESTRARAGVTFGLGVLVLIGSLVIRWYLSR